MSVINLVKRSAESAPYGYDFVNDAVIAAGDTIASVTSVTATLIGSTPPGLADTLVLGSFSFSGTVVSLRVSGGLSGTQYEVEFRVLTAGGYTRVGLGQLSVDDQ